jgi:hypothetical protein
MKNYLNRILAGSALIAVAVAAVSTASAQNGFKKGAAGGPNASSSFKGGRGSGGAPRVAGQGRGNGGNVGGGGRQYSGRRGGGGGAAAAGVALGVLGVIGAAAAANERERYYEDGYVPAPGPRYYQPGYGPGPQYPQQYYNQD